MDYPKKDDIVFEIGERVAWITGNHELQYGIVVDTDPLGIGRVPIRDENGFTARPTSDRVAKLK